MLIAESTCVAPSIDDLDGVAGVELTGGCHHREDSEHTFSAQLRMLTCWQSLIQLSKTHEAFHSEASLDSRL